MSGSVVFEIDYGGENPVAVVFYDSRTGPDDSSPVGIFAFLKKSKPLHIGSCQIKMAAAGIAPGALMVGAAVGFHLYRTKATVGEVILRRSSDKHLLDISVPELGIDGSCELSSEARLRLTQLLRGEMEVA